MFSIEHERDIERLRQVALLQKNQLETLIKTLADKCAELEKLKGSREDPSRRREEQDDDNAAQSESAQTEERPRADSAA